MDPNAPTYPTMAEQGQVYVTLAAAEAYADARELRLEEARRELTELLLGARGPRGNADYDHYTRKVSRGGDDRYELVASVRAEGPLLVVVHLQIRGLQPPAQRRGRRP